MQVQKSKYKSSHNKEDSRNVTKRYKSNMDCLGFPLSTNVDNLQHEKLDSSYTKLSRSRPASSMALMSGYSVPLSSFSLSGNNTSENRHQNPMTENKQPKLKKSCAPALKSVLSPKHTKKSRKNQIKQKKSPVAKLDVNPTLGGSSSLPLILITTEHQMSKAQAESMSSAIHRRSQSLSLQSYFISSLQAKLNNHSVLQMSKPGTTVCLLSLLKAWERFIILSNWSRDSANLSIADFVLLSLILGSITSIIQAVKDVPCPNFSSVPLSRSSQLKKIGSLSNDVERLNQQNHVYSRMTHTLSSSSSSSSSSSLANKGDFLVDYHIAAVLAPLRAIELFYVALITTKLILDIEEAQVHGIGFGAIELELLAQALEVDAVLGALLSRKLSIKRFKWIKDALFSLQLFVLDISIPLGKYQVTGQSYQNSDEKIQTYISYVLNRPIVEEDWMPLEIKAVL